MTAIYGVIAVALVGIAAVLFDRRFSQRELPRLEVADPAAEIVVYVSGAIRNPGIYALTEGDRIADALKLAGGATEEADLDRLNQAVRIQDEMQIHVPRRGESSLQAATLPASSASIASSAATTGPIVHVNRASAAELESLPGVGPVTSARILDYRAKNGGFRSKEQLKDLKLISAATFEKIKDRLSVD